MDGEGEGEGEDEDGSEMLNKHLTRPSTDTRGRVASKRPYFISGKQQRRTSPQSH